MLEWLFMTEIDIEKYEFNDIYFNLISGFSQGRSRTQPAYLHGLPSAALNL